ncbi:unnamed protein product [Linum trigynum]|uniref:Uncharacterized protein n=1 Tax=Linum trigynum TaxID=586398 RepID=A0AAV2CRJ2_9ROSI
MPESFSLFDACISIFNMEKQGEVVPSVLRLNMGNACLRRSVLFPGDKRTTTKMNNRGRLSLVRWVGATKKHGAAGENNVGANFLIKDES